MRYETVLASKLTGFPVRDYLFRIVAQEDENTVTGVKIVS